MRRNVPRTRCPWRGHGREAGMRAGQRSSWRLGRAARRRLSGVADDPGMMGSSSTVSVLPASRSLFLLFEGATDRSACRPAPDADFCTSKARYECGVPSFEARRRPDMSKLSNKVAIVTGASKGNWRRHCPAPGRGGRRRRRQLRLQQGRRRSGRRRHHRAGAAGPSRCRPTWRRRRRSIACSPRRRRRSARLDILVNNAGIYEFDAARGGHRGALSSARST